MTLSDLKKAGRDGQIFLTDLNMEMCTYGLT